MLHKEIILLVILLILFGIFITRTVLVSIKETNKFIKDVNNSFDHLETTISDLLSANLRLKYKLNNTSYESDYKQFNIIANVDSITYTYL